MVDVPARSWRRVALLTVDRRFDLAVPLDDSLDDVARRLGLTLVAGRHALVDRTGRETAAGVRGAELDDGALIAIVDLESPAPAARGRGAFVRADAREPDRGILGWLLLVAGLVLSAAALAGLPVLVDPVARAVAGVLLAGAAGGSALAWTLHRSDDVPGSALAMLAPLVLAFAGGAVIVPPGLEGGAHLAVAAGLLAAGIVAALVAVATGGPRLRGGARTATVVLLGLALMWGLALVAGWGPVAAAAVSAGIAPLGLRGLSSTLLDLAEGYHIDYRHFMSSRWTVRGVIPEDPGPVRMADVRAAVEESTARLVVGTVLLSAVPVLVIPLVLPGLAAADLLVRIGSIALLAAVVLALLLAPRRAALPVLRWVPRAAAALVALEVALALALGLPALGATLAAAGLLAVGLATIAALGPVSGGAHSLGWSRFADLGEWLAIALALPAAFLAADAVGLLRGMMAG